MSEFAHSVCTCLVNVQAYRAAVIAARRAEAVLEESGSCYAVGSNDRGHGQSGRLLVNRLFPGIIRRRRREEGNRAAQRTKQRRVIC